MAVTTRYWVNRGSDEVAFTYQGRHQVFILHPDFQVGYVASDTDGDVIIKPPRVDIEGTRFEVAGDLGRFIGNLISFAETQYGTPVDQWGVAGDILYIVQLGLTYSNDVAKMSVAVAYTKSDMVPTFRAPQIPSPGHVWDWLPALIGDPPAQPPEYEGPRPSRFNREPVI